MSTARKCKTKYLVKSAFIYMAVSAGLIIGAKALLAQENQTRTIVISPPSINDRFDAGSNKEGTVKISNTSPTDTITFTAVVRDFIVEDTKGTPLINVDFGPNKAKYAASSWIAIYPTTFTLAPGKSQIVSYYIQIPKDARPGGRYAAVVYESQDRIGVKGSGTGVETHIGSLFVMRINGDIVENASVSRFGAEKVFWEYGPVKILTQLYNGSDSHIRPRGTVTIKNIIGQTVDSQPLREENIFPEAPRDFSNTLGKKLMFGSYTAEFRGTYGDKGDKTLFAAATFFVIPWKIVALVGLTIVVVVLLVIYLRRRKKNNHHAAPPVQPPAPSPTS